MFGQHYFGPRYFGARYWSGTHVETSLDDITDTDILQKPINVVLAGDMPIKGSGREYDLRPLNFKSVTTVSSTPARRLKGGKPSFTVKTDTKGYN